MLSFTLNKKIDSNRLDLPMDGYTVSMYSSVSDISSEWNMLADDNLFCHSSFLTALEEAPPSGTTFRYALIYKEGKRAGLVYFQVKRIDLSKSLRLDKSKPKNRLEYIWNKTKATAATLLNSTVLVCGNMTLTGNNGHIFDSEVPEKDRNTLLHDTIEKMIAFIRSQGINPKAVLCKDFFTNDILDFASRGYTKFSVQPNMILDIDPDWQNFDNYVNALKKKYRTRVRRARKKSLELNSRILSLEEIHAYTDEISKLYTNVAEQAGFNLFFLPKNYFYSLQKHLKDKMTVVGYFDGDRMVGFFTHIKSEGNLDAHFLGYDPECNKNCQLYLNMLYDLVDSAIRLRCPKLIMSRTAMEIKSSVGAEGHNMVLYLKTTNKIINKGVERGLKYFTPVTEWQPRNPFK